MTGDETLWSYWSRAIHIQTRLNGINMNIPDTTLQTWLLRGLPPAYDNYGDIATNHAGADVDIYAMFAFLQVHEVKHHVKQAQSAAGGVLRAFSRKCYSCGSEQHTAAMCPARLATHPGRVSVFQRISSSVHCGQVLPYHRLPFQFHVNQGAKQELESKQVWSLSQHYGAACTTSRHYSLHAGGVTPGLM